MIKPDGMKHRKAILAWIDAAGFKILRQKVWDLPQEAAEELYEEHKARRDLPGFHAAAVAYVRSGKVMSLELEAPDAVRRWRLLMSPVDQKRSKSHSRRHGTPITKYICDPRKATREDIAVHGSNPETAAKTWSLRALFGDQTDNFYHWHTISRTKSFGFQRNAVHGSDPERAEKEIALIFDRDRCIKCDAIVAPGQHDAKQCPECGHPDTDISGKCLKWYKWKIPKQDLRRRVLCDLLCQTMYS